MHVSEVMTKSADLTDPNETVRNAAIKMRHRDVGSLPVGENDRLIGIVTDRDIVLRAVAESHSPDATAVRDVMSHNVFYCFEDDDVFDAAHLMAQKQVRRLPVLNRDKRVVGILSVADLSRKGGELLKAAKEAAAGTAQKGEKAQA